jgi:hypothetical protein
MPKPDTIVAATAAFLIEFFMECISEYFLICLTAVIYLFSFYVFLAGSFWLLTALTAIPCFVLCFLRLTSELYF